jgi:hypothetical protein
MSSSAEQDDFERRRAEAEADAALADYIRDQVCCPRIHGCELGGMAECPAERVRAALARAAPHETAAPASWPATRDIVLPRDATGRQPDAAAFILGLAAQPWKLAAIANLLRDSGEVDVPRKVEGEMAAALHWMLGLAMREGDEWDAAYSSAVVDLKRRAVERLQPATAAAPTETGVDQP